MNNEQTEVLKRLVPIEELKTKYGEELVNTKIQEVEKQLGGKVTELDEYLFDKVEEQPEVPQDEEVVQILALMTELYLSEGRVLRLIELQKKKSSKHIPREFRQRLNNLFVNNRVIMDYFHKKFNWDDISYQNELANAVETITNLFIACRPEDREHCLVDFRNYLENKYIKPQANL